MRTITCIIERPDGTTYEQQVTLKENETPEDACKRLQRTLGRSYWVVDWYE